MATAYTEYSLAEGFKGIIRDPLLRDPAETASDGFLCFNPTCLGCGDDTVGTTKNYDKNRGAIISDNGGTIIIESVKDEDDHTAASTNSSFDSNTASLSDFPNANSNAPEKTGALKKASTKARKYKRKTRVFFSKYNSLGKEVKGLKFW